MRVAGVLAPYALCDPKSVTADLLLASAFTHDDRSANAACLGWGACLLALATRDRIRTADDLFDVFMETASPMEGPRQMQTRSPHIACTGKLCDFIDQVVRPAHRAPATLARERDGWYRRPFCWRPCRSRHHWRQRVSVRSLRPMRRLRRLLEPVLLPLQIEAYAQNSASIRNQSCG